MTYNPKIKNTSNTDMSIDANVDANNITMGEADDGVWEDGLFAFSTETKVGTAIDKINELLKGLAPKVPSDLNNLSSTTGGTNVRFAKQDYIMEALSDRSKVQRLESYIKEPATDFQRLGAYKTPPTLTLTLNGDKQADEGNNRTNLPADSFRVVRGKSSTFKVTVNDIGVRQITINNQEQVSHEQTFLDLVSGDVIVPDPETSETDTEISLSAVSDGTFLSTGEVFNLFQHRTGTITLRSSLFGVGFNSVKITHQIEGEQEVETNYVEFVVDSLVDNNLPLQEIPAILNLTKGSSDTLKDGTPKYISGVAYYRGNNDSHYDVQGNIGEFASDFYSNESDGGIKKASLSRTIQGGASLQVSHTLSNISYDSTSGIDFTTNTYYFAEAGNNEIKVSVPSNSRVLNDSPDVKVALVDVFDTSLERGSAVLVYGENIMFDNYAITSTDLVENFDDENKRVSLDENLDLYGAGGELNAAAVTPWNSAAALTNNDLAIQGGALKSISQVVVAQSPMQTNTLPLVNAESAVYYREFVSGGPIPKGRFQITLGADAAAEYVVDENGNENTNISKIVDSGGVEINISVKNGANQWLSLLSTSVAGGCRADNEGTDLTTNVTQPMYGFDLGTAVTDSNGRIYVKVETSQALKGEIKKIQLFV